MVHIIVSSDPRYSINKSAIQSTVVGLLERHRIAGNIEIGINVVGDRKMHAINSQYRGIDSTTNILSFALEDPVAVSNLQHISRAGFIRSPDNILRLGDILISYPELLKDASIEGVSVEEQLLFLVEHGTKHLLGIHHS